MAGWASVARPRQQPPSGTKRPPAVALPGAPASKAARLQEGEPALAVIAEAEDEDDSGLHEIVCGVYAEVGSNHGRRFFKKLSGKPGQKTVYIYYHAGGGEDFQGWWFGDEVGGEEVWLRNTDGSSEFPPATGWTWQDGIIRHDLRVVVNGAEESQGAFPRGGKGQAGMPLKGKAGMPLRTQQEQQLLKQHEQEEQQQQLLEDWQQRLEVVSAQVDAVEVESSQALDVASLVADDSLGLQDDSATQALQILGAQKQPLLTIMRSVTSEGFLTPTAPPPVRAAALELNQRVRKLQTNVTGAEKQLLNMRRERMAREEAERRRVQEEARSKLFESRHADQLEAIRNEAVAKMESMQEQVDKVLLAAQPLEVDTMDYFEEAMLPAVEETERCARAASAVLMDVRRVVTAKAAHVRKLIPGTKLAILDELSEMQTRVSETQKKLAPFNAVRQRHKIRLQARKLADELAEQLNTAEIDVEKATMAAGPLFSDSTQAAKDAEKPLAAAQAAVSRIANIITSKVKGAQRDSDVMQQGLAQVQERMELMQEKLKEAQQSVREMQLRGTADKWLQELSEKSDGLEIELQKMAETQAAFGEEMDDQELTSFASNIEKLGPSVQGAISDAQAFCRKMLALVSRSPGGPMEEVKDAVSDFQTRLTEALTQLKQFNTSALSVRRKHLLQEVQREVAAAEDQLQQLADAVATLGTDLGVAPDGGADEAIDVDDDDASVLATKEKLKQVVVLERVMQTRIVALKKATLDTATKLHKLPGAETDIDGNAASDGDELAALQSRLNTMQLETTKLRKEAKAAEERQASRKVLQEAAAQVKAAETEADEACNVAATLVHQDPVSADSVENVERLIFSARSKADVAAKNLGLKARVARGVVAEDLQALGRRLQDAQERLNQAAGTAQGRAERVRATLLVAQATEQLQRVEDALQGFATAQGALVGDEDLPVEHVEQAMADCETALQSAQKAAASGKSLLSKAMAEARRLSGEHAAPCMNDLGALQDQLDASATDLKQGELRMAERKRVNGQRLAEHKVSCVEAAVEKLKGMLGELANEQLATLSPEEALKACEELVAVDGEASKIMSLTQDFLAGLLKQAKSQGLQGGTAVAEVSKTQARLRQRQVELARLTRDVQARKQRVASQQLLREVPPSIARLETEVQKAQKVAAPLLVADKSGLLDELHARAVIVGLRAYMEKHGTDSSALFAKITENETVSVQQLSTFLEGLPPSEPEGAFLASLSGEQAAFSLMKAAARSGSNNGDGMLSAEALKLLMQDLFVCTERQPLVDAAEGGTEIGMLEAGEVVDVVEQQELDGVVHAKCVLARDDSAGWVTLCTSGKQLLKPSTSGAPRLDSIFASVEALCRQCIGAAAEAERKVGECAGSAQAHPSLADVRSTLLQLKMQVSVHRTKVEQVRKRVASARDSLLQQWEASREKSKDSRSQLLIDGRLADAISALDAAEEAANKLIADSKVDPSFLKTEEGIALVKGTKKVVDEASKTCSEAKALAERFAEEKGGTTGSSRQQVLKIRVELMKILSRQTKVEKRCRTTAEGLW